VSNTDTEKENRQRTLKRVPFAPCTAKAHYWDKLSEEDRLMVTRAGEVERFSPQPPKGEEK
jgi:hypothetical protein